MGKVITGALAAIALVCVLRIANTELPPKVVNIEMWAVVLSPLALLIIWRFLPERIKKRLIPTKKEEDESE